LHADITSSRGCPYAELFPPRALDLRVEKWRRRCVSGDILVEKRQLLARKGKGKVC